MTSLESQLLSVLQSIRGNGSFVVSGKSRFVLPGLHIGGLGEMGFPLNPLQLQAVIGLAKKAPFGKGGETVTDTTVRSAWEIDASQLDFRNPQWELTLRKMVKKVQLGLGIEEKTIGHSLYKMLIYEKGDFFLPHKDSEKEKGMFGTLIVGLPAAHTGGTLAVRFDEREELVDFSGPASNYELPYVAFYADCEHEIKPITSGYRVCLVYNLIQGAETSAATSPRFSRQVASLATLLDAWADSKTDFPKAILLGHEYTPANFSRATLKHHDRPRAEALFAAAERAGYFARPGLVTHYQMGELESGRDYDYNSRYRRNSYEEDDKAEETMGEVYEAYTTVEHWAEEDEANLGHLSISEEDLLTEIHIGEGEPTEQEAEYYTGNAGMTMEYWYHYGAVVLWPRKQHIELVLDKPDAVRLAWLEFYLKHWEKYGGEAPEYVRRLTLTLALEASSADRNRYMEPDFSIMAKGLARLQDETFLKAHGIPVLTAFFERIASGSWIDLLHAYDPASLEPVFQAACSSGKALAIYRLVGMLELLSAAPSPALHAFLLGQIDRIPDYLSHVSLEKIKDLNDWDTLNIKQKAASLFIVNQLLTLSRWKEKDDAWTTRVLEQITRSLPRNYVNGVLVKALMGHPDQTGTLYRRLYEACSRHIAQSTAIRPTPLPDWTRAVPHSKRYKEVWEMLGPFLTSPTEQVFEYRKAQQYRSEVESAISNATIDLRTETITRGSPHTLRIIKTQAEYERALKIWEEDVALLAEMERIRP